MRCCLDLGYHQIACQMIRDLEAELPEDLSLVAGVGVDQDPGDVRELVYDGLDSCSVRRRRGSGFDAARA
jgi:hypothetical protein